MKKDIYSLLIVVMFCIFLAACRRNNNIGPTMYMIKTEVDYTLNPNNPLDTDVIVYRSFSYDAQGRLSQAIVDFDTINYTYTPSSIITYGTQGGVTIVYPLNSQGYVSSDQFGSYAYNAQGYRISDTARSGTGTNSITSISTYGISNGNLTSVTVYYPNGTISAEYTNTFLNTIDNRDYGTTLLYGTRSKNLHNSTYSDSCANCFIAPSNTETYTLDNQGRVIYDRSNSTSFSTYTYY